MEINKSNIKYKEWRSTEDMHEDTLNAISELRFINDEQQFLEDLIKNYTIDLIAEDTFTKSREVISSLSRHRKDLKPLLKKTMTHSNMLQTLLDDDEIPGEIERYKEAHHDLMVEVVAYYTKFKRVKRKIFSLVQKIIKHKKQKKLLC
jgi:hypothetical protein